MAYLLHVSMIWGFIFLFFFHFFLEPPSHPHDLWKKPKTQLVVDNV